MDACHNLLRVALARRMAVTMVAAVKCQWVQSVSRVSS